MDPIFLEYSSRREQLNELINRSDSGLATELGIELIEATDYSEDKEKTRHCHWYTFLNYPRFWKDYIIQQHLAQAPPGFSETTRLEDAAIVLYFNSLGPKNGFFPHLAKGKIVHSGRVEGGQVISKFTFGGVYRHTVEDVPAIYGDQAVLLSRLPEDKAEQEMSMVLSKKWYEGGMYL